MTHFIPANGLLFDPNEGSQTDSYEGFLRCPCGCEAFRIRHNGRLLGPLQRLWAADWFRPANGQPLVIGAACTGCGRETLLHCSDRDEQGWLLPASPAMQDFAHPRLRDQRVRLYVWYCWDDQPERENGQFLTTYSLFSLSAYSDEHPDGLHIYEKTC